MPKLPVERDVALIEEHQADQRDGLDRHEDQEETDDCCDCVLELPGSCVHRGASTLITG